ncbi:hypothetical protein ABZ135_37350 [Streptomyces sp. NPDC006339]|uniref:hypothetical protein n=1 Tax=Streptomyces sp. NPDC006339 TaxID=3156755 RepID=UPI0033A63995
MDPQPRPEAAQTAAALIAAVEAAYAPAETAYRDPAPLPVVGTTPPVAQPGRPPMSQKATDASVVMLAAGAASLPIGGSAALVLWALGQVDPVVLALAAGAPVAVLATLGRLLGRAKQAAEAAPPTHHHHYAGPVHQDHRHTETTARGLIARAQTKSER